MPLCISSLSGIKWEPPVKVNLKPDDEFQFGLVKTVYGNSKLPLTASETL